MENGHLHCCSAVELFTIFIMPLTSKKLRRHIGLGLSVMRVCVCGSHFAYGQERLEIGS